MGLSCASPSASAFSGAKMIVNVAKEIPAPASPQVTFDAVLYDTGGYTDASKNKVTVSVDGWYRLSWSASVVAVSPPNIRAIAVLKTNGASLDSSSAVELGLDDAFTRTYGTSEPYHILSGTAIHLEIDNRYTAAADMFYFATLAIEYLGS